MSGLAQFNFIRLGSTLPLQWILQLYKTLSSCALWLRNSERILDPLPFIYWLLLLFSLTGDRNQVTDGSCMSLGPNAQSANLSLEKSRPNEVSRWAWVVASYPLLRNCLSSTNSVPLYSLPRLLKPTECEVWNKFLYIWWWTCYLYPSGFKRSKNSTLKRIKYDYIEILCCD